MWASVPFLRLDGRAPHWLKSASLATLTRVAWELSRQPRTLLSLPKGAQAVAAEVSRGLLRRFEERPLESATVGGLRLFFNPNDPGLVGHSIAARTYEIPVTQVATRVIRKGDTVLDIGANIGYYTLLAAHLTTSTGRVVGFEPHPQNIQTLARSVEYNHLNWVRAEPLVVSDTVGYETLYVSDDASLTDQHSIVRHVGSSGIRLPSTTLDDYLQAQGLSSVRFLKVDVEGAEPKVLRGARRAIAARIIDCMVVEWNPEAWEGEADLFRELASVYDVYPMLHDGIGLVPVGVGDIPPTLANLLLLRRGSDLS